ncbi:g12913 [Coccomyxa viridis]|uniref:histidinol-phosphatase n=1 Tax=Coccomyxa viridis TaxID=1274662 RepID=A0ABP1GBI0_9CHLO
MANGTEGSSVEEAFIELANRLADAAAEITTKYFRSPLAVDSKADTSPVTEADRQAEAAMKALIHESFPSHDIFGEESGMEPGKQPEDNTDPKYLWVIDPIDGTKSFITGKPVFGTLIALLRDGVPVLGVIDQPITKERWLGVQGRPTTLNGQTVSTRATCTDLRAAYLYATTPHMFQGDTEKAFNAVRDQVRIPLYGCDCYAYGLLAAGFCDLVVEADMKPYDYMALVPIVEGAGGVMSDWKGDKLRWHMTPSHGYAIEKLPGEVVAAGSKELHEECIKLLAWTETDPSGPSSQDMNYTM